MGLRLTAFIFLSAYILFLIGVYPVLCDAQARAAQASRLRQPVCRTETCRVRAVQVPESEPQCRIAHIPGHYELLVLEIVGQASLPVEAARSQLRATLEPTLVAGPDPRIAVQ